VQERTQEITSAGILAKTRAAGGVVEEKGATNFEYAVIRT